MAKYENDVKQLLELVGGKANINTVANCATRMRFVLADDSKADVEAIEKLDSVKGTFTNAGQFQVIIGNDVPTFYREFIANAGITEATKADVKQAGAANQSPLQRAIAFLADIFVPLIPALVAGGLMLGFRNILEAKGLPWMPEGETYLSLESTKFAAGQLHTFLWWFAEAVFAFLPVGVTWSAVRRLGGTPILGIIMGIMLVSGIMMNAYSYGNASTYKDGVNLALIKGTDALDDAKKTVDKKLEGQAKFDAEDKAISEAYKAVADYKEDVVTYTANGEEVKASAVTTLADGKMVTLDTKTGQTIEVTKTVKENAKAITAKYQWDVFGFKINLIGYQALVLPALFAAIALVYIEKFMNKITPDVVKIVVVPFVTLVVTGILAITIIGPLARLLGDTLANVFKFLLATPGLNIFGGLLFGATYAPLVITGLHHTFIAVDLQLAASQGGTPIWPMIAMSNISQSMAALGVFFLATRQKDEKLAEVSISGAVSAWFGITEPAMFGANLKLSYPFIAAITASAIGGAILSIGGVQSNSIGVGGLALAWASIKFTGNHQLFFWIATAVTCAIALGGTLVLSKTGLKLPSKKK